MAQLLSDLFRTEHARPRGTMGKNHSAERSNAATRWGQVTLADDAKPTQTEIMDTTISPTGLATVPCSALDAALALIALGPQRSANAVEWCRVSLEMCRHCKGTENVNEAAARITAEAHAVLSDFARTAPGRLPSAVQDALAPWRPNAEAIHGEKGSTP